ncbi:MAG: oligosaccharide flippase family protein [Anaerolineae bacterium]
MADPLPPLMISDFGFRISDFRSKGHNRKWRGWEVALAFLLLLIVFFWPVVFGGRTLVPFDIPFATDPVWAGRAAELDIDHPHNGLVADLILENYVWKQFIRDSIRARQLPLWNPYIFAGVPFLAAGQHSALYPLSIIYYILPLWRAFGVFTVVQLWLAGLFMYTYVRVLGAGRFGAVFAGLAYMLSGLMLVNVVFPMIIAAMSWLPLLLAAIEVLIRAQEDDPSTDWLPRGRRLLALLAVGVIVGLQFLAGHVEISYYILLVAAFYASWRLTELWRRRGLRVVLTSAMWLAGLAVVGVALAGVQLIPLYELVTLNFRQGAAGFQQVLGWAYPSRQIIAFLIPDFFGNPAHHRVFDLFSRQWVELPGSTEWGIKNYVEGTAYVGILPLLLASLAVILRRSRHVWFFVVLAVLSLLFAFGTPAYALLYYGLPGLSQVHTPFRWVFPYSVAVAVLAGLGADWLVKRQRGQRSQTSQKGQAGQRGNGGSGVRAPAVNDGSLAGWLGWGMVGAGGAVLGGLALGYVRPGAAMRLADRIMQTSARAVEAFGEPSLFLSYQFWNVGLLGIFLLGAGVILVLWRRGWRVAGMPAWQVVAVIVLIADLWAMGHDFYPRVQPALRDETPPVVQFLQQDDSLYRVASYGPAHVLWPNAGMRHGIHDIRGYDSIIPRQYTDYMAALGTQDLLLYNRIGPLNDPATLDSPRLDLLNVKYVLSTEDINHLDFRQVFRDGDVRVYEHTNALPRALLTSETPSDFPPASRFTFHASRITRYTPNGIEIAVETETPQTLVLTDSYFPGWRAFVTPASGEEREVEIVRAFENFRAVEVPAGQSAVRFKYFPMSVKAGMYVSFLGAVVLFLGFIYWLWTQLYRPSVEGETAHLIAKNSLVPMGASLLNKAVDFAFAMFMLRILGPTDAGKYYFAIVVIGFVDIFTNFGLNLLLTREVAKDRSQANRYLSNTALLRLVLWVVSLPLAAMYVLFRQVTQPLDTATIIAIALFSIGLIPGSISAAFSSLFTAYEQMEVPAAVTTVTTLLKVSLGALALLLGYGFVGLAGVSVIVNTITALIFLRLVIRRFFRPHLEFDPRFVWGMVGIAAPLMLNHLLQTVFFKIDIVILDQYWPEAVVGWYSTAYKWIDALLIIPAYFTMAIFPLMSRRAESDRAGLMSAYTVSLRVLLMLALPIAMGTVFIADELIQVLGGSEYLPHGAIALQLMIWFLPLSFVNGVTQYVLIALDQQRWITVSFAIATAFNLLMNLLLIPRLGYPAAALITIASEVVLFIPFYTSIRTHLGSMPLVSLAWRPAIATALLGGTMWVLGAIPNLVALAPAGIVYVAALVMLGAFTPEDRALARRLLPRRLRGWRPRGLRPNLKA